MPSSALRALGEWSQVVDSDGEMDDQATAPLSFDSDMHVSGRCKPCAHFHRPYRCAHGDDCMYCHVCPPGEKQRRKVDRRREVQQSPKKKYTKVNDESYSPVSMDARSTNPSRTESLNITSSATWNLELGHGIGYLQSGFESDLEPGHRRSTMDFAVENTTMFYALAAWSHVVSSDKMDDRAMPSLSFGSDVHASGRCKPCAHFHRLQGCAHGDDCMYCHACPPGEKQRRKVDCRREVQQSQKKKHMNVHLETPSAVSTAACSSNSSRAHSLDTASSVALGLENHLELGHSIGTMDFEAKNTFFVVANLRATETLRRNSRRSKSLPKEWKPSLCFNLQKNLYEMA